MNQVQKLRATDAAYIAGIIDGEGTITLIRKHRNENRQLSVSISSTERVLLDHILNVLGVGKITTKKISQEKHSPSFTYAVYNRQALTVLEYVTPFLKTYKALRARLILAHYIRLTPRNGKYSRELLRERIDFENAVLNIKANRCVSSELLSALVHK